MNGSATVVETHAVDLTIVITCYNEDAFITDTLRHVSAALVQAGRSHEIIVIDDVSQDGSVERIRTFMREHPDCPIVLKINARNQGLANNYVDAAFLGRGKYYRLCCGDDSESFETLVNIFRHVGKADMVIPYQIQKNVSGKSPLRKLTSNIFTFLVNLLSGYRIRYYNGLAVHLRYNVMRWHPTSYGFGFQADIITRLLDEGVSYLQIPATSVDRKGKGSTALTLRNLLSVAHTLLEVTIRRLRKILYGHSPEPAEIPADKVSPR